MKTPHIRTFETGEAKNTVRLSIAKKVSGLAKTKKTTFETLCADSLDHEKMLRKMSPNLNLISRNWSAGFIDKLKPIDSLHSLVVGDIHNVKRDFKKGQSYAIWFDYCDLVEPWDCFFQECKNNNFDLVFVTFSAKKRGLVNSIWPKINLGIKAKELTDDMLAERIAKLAHKRMRFLGYLPIESIVYTTTGGRMVTIGFKKDNSLGGIGSTKITYFENSPIKAKTPPAKLDNKNENSDERYQTLVNAADLLRKAGFSAKEITDKFSCSIKIAGLFRAATVRAR